MNKHFLPALTLILLGVSTRFLPHPANFTALGAIAIFSGIYLPRKWALCLPLAAMFLSDIFLGFYSWPIMLSVYAGFAIMGLIGMAVKKRKNAGTILAGTLLGSVIFFLLSNFSVWAFGSWYEHSLSGLYQCFFLALPFFKNSLIGDLFYAGILSGSYELALAYMKRSETAPSRLLEF
jgi:hypothetical protein